MPDAGPGRSCPRSYAYGAAALSGAAELRVETLWVAGGLYGNPFALERLLELYAQEAGSKALVFNGDFHWFDVDGDEFARINAAVLGYRATRGNIESELARPEAGAGCGCAYPDWVDDATVARSNRVQERLRGAALTHPEGLARLASLPMHLVAEVGGERVGVVHGDADSLAGWGFSQEILLGTKGRAKAIEAFDRSGVRVFASSHTCLPVLQRLPRERIVVNNGSAGMPNFRGTAFGLATRISVFPGRTAVYSVRVAHLFVEAVALEYDAPAWQRRFLAQWPEGSDAHASYYDRMVHGPRYGADAALRLDAALAA